MLRGLLLSLSLSLGLAAPVLAGGTEPSPVISAELLPGWRDGGEHVAALRLKLSPGWKTYWRAPGEAGIPPDFDWTGSDNLAAVRFQWPAPRVFRLNGLRTIGYKDELILPIVLTPRDPSQPITVKAQVALGVCEQVCVPFELKLAALLPAGGAPDPAIRAALADRPRSGAEAGVTKVACTVDPIRDGLRVTATLLLPPGSGEEMVVIETGTPGVWVSEADSRRDGTRLTATADLVPPQAQPFPLDRSQIRLTVLSADRAIDIRGCPAG